MRAKFIKNGDPKKSLGIGLHGIIQDKVKEIKEIDSSDPMGWNCVRATEYDPGLGILSIDTLPGDDCSEYFEEMLQDLGIGKFFNLSHGDESYYEFDLKPEYRNVNEAQNFERGKNPKTALGLGGVVLENKLGTRIDELEYEMAMVAKAAGEEYAEWLRKTFVGKTITAEMQNHPRMNPKTKKTSPSKGSGEFTIKVQDMLPGDSIEDMMNKENFTGSVENQSVIVASTEGDIYSIKVRNKIYVE